MGAKLAPSPAGEAVRAGAPTPDGGPDGKLFVGGVDCVTFIGGVALCAGIIECGSGGTGGVAVLDIEGGGPPAALTALDGGPLGGGAFGASVAVGAGSFLLIHFLSSLS